MRLYSNFQKGTLTASAGTAGTTLNSAEFASLPAVAAPDTLTLVLDPLEALGSDPEVVTVVAHTAGATSCNVLRAQDGTAANNAAFGMTWIHAATKGDMEEATRGQRPLLRKSRPSATSQNLVNATATNLIFPDTDHNLPGPNGAFDLPSTSLFSPPEDGIYEVVAQIQFGSGSATSTRRLLTLHNNTDGTTMMQVSTPSIPNAGQDTHVQMAVVAELLASKDYAIRGRQDSGGGLTIDGPYTWMQVLWLSASS